jgi:DNA mismatch repair protein MutL
MVQKAITSCYKDYLMVQQKPFFVLFVELDPKTIDINVHPKKRIVKLQNEYLFLSLLREVIEKQIYSKKEGDVPTTRELSSFPEFKYPSLKQELHASDLPINKENKLMDTAYNQPITPPIQSPLYFSNEIRLSTQKYPLVLNNHIITKILGQVQNTYIVCETTVGVLFIDQHAAAERINLEKNRLVHSLNFDKQRLIIKIKLDSLSQTHKEVILKHKKELSVLGFDIEKDKQNYYLLTIPRFLNNYLDINYFVNILEDLKNKECTVDKLKDNLIKLFSCKNSIKANEPLSAPEILGLINDLEKCNDKTICAHGRPTIIYFSKNELDKMFKRII